MPWETILRLADILGVQYHARMKWKERGYVPPKWHFALVMESAKHGENLTMETFTGRQPKRAA